jgi:hypothetical protein
MLTIARVDSGSGRKAAIMLSTSASKVFVSAFVVLASVGGHTKVEKTVAEIPVTLDETSLLVATLANGEIERHRMGNVDCERVVSAIAAREFVTGVRDDGVRLTIVRANCSTRRVLVGHTATTSNSEY